jgi:hypothetical protein
MNHAEHQIPKWVVKGTKSGQTQTKGSSYRQLKKLSESQEEQRNE